MTSNPEIPPTLLPRSFSFDEIVPDHIEGDPRIPNYIGMYAVARSNASKIFRIASDIRTEDDAKIIADAAAKHQEETIDKYGYSDNVLIVHPNGETTTIYSGRRSKKWGWGR